jgi:hypothetical protein
MQDAETPSDSRSATSDSTELRRAEDPSRGKGGHTLFFKVFPEGVFSYPIPVRKDVLPCYVKGCRKKFRLAPEDGVSDEDFFGRA